MRTEQEVWKEYREVLKFLLHPKHVRTEDDIALLEEVEWVLYIGAENEFDEFGKRMGGMKDERSIREGVYNKELRDWLLGGSS